MTGSLCQIHQIIIKEVLILPINNWIIQHSKAVEHPREIKTQASHFQVKLFDLERIDNLIPPK